MMKEKVAEAIIENGKIKYIDKKLPHGVIKVKLIYSVEEEPVQKTDVEAVIRNSSGIYKNINPDKESSNLRTEWERNIGN